MEESNPLDSYSPFDNPNEANQPTESFSVNSPSISASYPKDDEIDDEELRALEQRVNQMESKINAQQLKIQNAISGNQLPPNWPSFYPIIHFDTDEVPALLRPFAKDAMLCWVVMSLSLFLNWIGCFSLLGVKENEISSPGSKIALSTLYLIVLTPLLMEFNFLSVYRVLKTEASSISYLKIFISIGITIAFLSILALGFDSSGSVGLVTMINLFIIKHWGIGLFSILVTLFLGFSALFYFKLIVELWHYFRGTEQGDHMENDLRTGIMGLASDVLSRTVRTDQNSNFETPLEQPN